VLEKLKQDIVASEGYLSAIFWNKPDMYGEYAKDKLNVKMFLNEVYGFYFGLGRYLFDKGIKIFDDLSVSGVIKELGLEKKYEKYGGFETISELVKETKHKEDNLEAYYIDIKKSIMVKNLYDFFGDKVLENNGNYNYKKMTKEEIHTYWNDKINGIGLDGDNTFEEHFLLEGLREYLTEVTENPKIGLPFYKSKLMTGISNGWTNSDVYMFGAFSNAGKTSLVFNKVIMSCIENKEKLCVIANEEGINSFKEKLFVTAMGTATNNAIARKKFKQGLTPEEDAKAEEAIKWIEKMTEGDSKLITFIFMENYVMKDVQKIVKRYHNRGVENFIIDTHKVSSGSKHTVRWEIFVEDMKTIHSLTRENGGGLSLRMWVNFQLKDEAIKFRYLDYDAIGEGKGAKNEAAVVYMMRSLWDDEYEGGKYEIEVSRWYPDEFDGVVKEHKSKIAIGRTVYLIFTPKNRNGANNENGQQILALEADFNRNSWKELGWCNVINDKSRRY
jgi:replicative DNA helicase